MTIEKELRSKILTYVDQVTGDVSVEAGKAKLGFMFGYFAGNSMSLETVDEESNLSSFSRQWKTLEDSISALNETRPVDFELAKDLASTVFVSRCRIAQGGFPNLYLTERELKCLDVGYMAKVVLKNESTVTVQDMTLFYAMMKSN